MFYNPYNNMFQYPTSNSPSSIEIPHVNGQNGAQAFQLPSNSSILLLDDNSPIVYLVKTDSAGYKSIKPYSITEYVPEKPVDMVSLLNRVDAIERRLNEQSNSSATNSTDKPIQSRTNQILDEYSSGIRKSNDSYGNHVND